MSLHDDELIIEYDQSVAEQLFTSSQLATLLQVPDSTVVHWRLGDGGPPYVRIGRHVRYRLRDIQKWLSERTVSV